MSDSTPAQQSSGNPYDGAGQFRYEERDGVVTITLDRPKRRNALTPAGYRALRDVTADLKTRGDDVRVVVIRGSEGFFCAGGDLDETARVLLDAGAHANFDFMQVAGELTRNLREMPQPVVAVVDGPAAGAGAAIALAADLRVFSDRASLSFVFTKIGLSGGDMGSAWLLQRLVGLSAATEILMLGHPVDAQRAKALNLAHRVCAPHDLDSEARDLVTELRERAPWGLQMTKDVLNRGAATDYDTGVQMETWTQSFLMTAPEFTTVMKDWVAKTAAKNQRN